MRSAELRRTAPLAVLLGLAVALAGCGSMPFGSRPATEGGSAGADATSAPRAVAPASAPATPEPAPAPTMTLAERAAAILREIQAEAARPAAAPGSAPERPAPASASAPPPAEDRTPAPAPETPVPPAAQRAFDAARDALRAGRVDEAERAFRALAKEHPELGGAHANLGLIYRQSGKLAESAAELEAAVKANPKQPAYANQLGITYRQQGAFAKAREAYESAIELDPGYAAAVLNLGILNDLYLWDGKRALELYERYLALKPGGDAVVTKWIADLKNRKTPPITVGRKEQP